MGNFDQILLYYGSGRIVCFRPGDGHLILGGYEL